MSGFKRDLSAIHRLEFYKKQRKWKLSHEKMNPKQKIVDSKKLHNKTYRIDSDEKQALFNDGFLVTPGETIQTYPGLGQPIPEPLMSTETTENIRNSGKEIQKEMSPTQERYMWLEPERDDQMWSNAVQDEEIPVWQDAVDQDMYSDIGAGESGWCDGEDPQWPTDPPVEVQPQWTHDCMKLVDEVQRWAPNYSPDNNTTYLQSHQELQSLDPGESFTEFSRGADAAPHSSELNLALDTGNCTCDCTCSSLARLTDADLKARVHAHGAALSALFAEILLRNTIKASNMSGCSHSHYTLQRPDMNPLPPIGRGRGRLREAQPLIRISMGRPYRCT